MANKIKKPPTAVKQRNIRKSSLKSNNAKTDDNISISLKYFYGKPECFSEWNKKELKKFQKLINKLRQYTEKTIAKDNSLDYKKCSLPKNKSIAKEISCEIASGSLCGLRASKKIRLYGCISRSVFYLIYLDKNHKLFK